ncbi:efflux transporter outer membrane subunit [Chitinilyticum litopenaei]|uniref:efflux transporter outer membrane subunit n=1 Tax=Chitinilyticum litopenaei TaxID=1121276 RepID=UPI0003FEA6E9|nr:efflux transporter outer membrane subunit [Chitinilyticum litopenaei]
MTVSPRITPLRSLPALLLLALSGCALQPVPTSGELREQQLPVLAERGNWSAQAIAGDPQRGWLADFNDPQLLALVQEAVGNNRDLLRAAARIEQARAMVAVNGGELYPAIGLKGVGGKSDTQILQLAASWEVDLWGRVRAQARAADAQLAATQADFAWAEQLVASTTARYWFGLLQYAQLETRLQGIIAAQEKLLALTRQRVATGISPASDIQDVNSALLQQRDQLRQLQLARTQLQQEFEVLLGRYPAASLAADRSLPALPAAPAAGLPASLLERRPDLIAAERRVAAAFDLQQSAQAARLPRIALTAAITDIQSDVFLLNAAETPLKGLSGSFLAPLFTGGQLKGQADYYTAVQKEAAIAYGSQALNALKEVEAGLQGEAALAERARLLEARLAEQHEALRREQVRVKVGSRDPRSVLAREQAVLAAESELLQLRTAQLNQRITLLLALGGGWQGMAATPAG